MWIHTFKMCQQKWTKMTQCWFSSQLTSLISFKHCLLYIAGWDTPWLLNGTNVVQTALVLVQWLLPYPWNLRGEYTFFSSNLCSKFSQCYYIVTRECHISPKSLCRELSKFTHYFDLVAMATLLILWLAKHGNGCNYWTAYRMLTTLGW